MDFHEIRLAHGGSKLEAESARQDIEALDKAPTVPTLP